MSKTTDKIANFFREKEELDYAKFEAEMLEYVEKYNRLQAMQEKYKEVVRDFAEPSVDSSEMTTRFLGGFAVGCLVVALMQGDSLPEAFAWATIATSAVGLTIKGVSVADAKVWEHCFSHEMRERRENIKNLRDGGLSEEQLAIQDAAFKVIDLEEQRKHSLKTQGGEGSMFAAIVNRNFRAKQYKVAEKALKDSPILQKIVRSKDNQKSAVAAERR